MGKKFKVGDLLNNQFKKNEAQAGAENLAPAEESSDNSQFIIRKIPLGQIRRSEKNQYGIRDIEEIATSIEAVGLLHNIVVKETEEANVYEIISGERRFLAYKLLFDGGKDEYATIPCKIEIREEDELSELRLLYANATARVLNDFEKTYQSMRIKEVLQSLKNKGYKFKGRLREIIADMLDVSSAQVSRMQRIYEDLIPEFMDEFKNEKIGITVAYDIAKLQQSEQEKLLVDYKEIGSEAIRRITEKDCIQEEDSAQPVNQYVRAADDVPTPAVQMSTKQEATHWEPKAVTRKPHDENETRTADLLKANKAQRDALLDFGKEAVRELNKTEDKEKRAEILGAINAFIDVASAFGIGGYSEEINAGRG